MEKQNNNKSNGFLMGFLLGMAAALLVTTKKGRKILRKFSENGWDKIGDLDDLIKNTLNENQDDIIDGDDFLIDDSQLETEVNESIKEEKVKEKEVKKEKNVKTESIDDDLELDEVTKVESKPEIKPFSKAKASTKRFFKGIKKRASIL